MITETAVAERITVIDPTVATSACAVSLRRVTKSYGERTAVRELNLDIASGENFAAALTHRAQGKLDPFRRARRDEDTICSDRKARTGVFRRYGLPGRRNAGGRAIRVVAVAHRARHRLDQVCRRFEPEGDRVADIEIADAGACRLNFLGLSDDIPNGVGKAVYARGRWNRRRGPGGCHAEDSTPTRCRCCVDE